MTAAPAAAATYIVGTPRSGTTLLRNLLDGHPELFVTPAETFTVDWCGASDGIEQFFAKTKYETLLAEDAEARATLEAELRRRLPAPIEATRAIPEVVAAIAAAYGRSGFDRWIEKTPKHHLIIGEILAAHGDDLRVIWVVRDPRAVLASQQRRWGKRRLWSFLRRWAIADELAARVESDPRVRVLRYEDLVTDTEAVMRDVAGHLGIAWDERLLATTRAGEPWTAMSGYQRVSTDSLARYRDDLPRATLALVEAVLGRRMQRRGYALEGVAAKLGPPLGAANEVRVAGAVRRLLAAGA